MPLPDHKTKIVATVGPASATPEGTTWGPALP